MTRVSENSSHTSLAFALSKAKNRMENLQMKGATLRQITKPSDNPAGNVEALHIQADTKDKKQYIKNIDRAKLVLNVTEGTLAQLTESMLKAKEIAIAQASDFYNPDSRKNVAQEVRQIRNHALSLSNKRIGNRFIFGGYKTRTAPFDNAGNYQGDTGRMTVEISKDFFIPINLHGREVFFTDKFPYGKDHPLDNFPELQKIPPQPKGEEKKEIPPIQEGPSRGIASVETDINYKADFHKRTNVFALLDTLATALETDDSNLIQDSIDQFDKVIDRVVNMRTRVGALTTSLEHKESELESNILDNETRRSKLVDADVIELFSDITKQQNILKATYQSSKDMVNNTLLDFIR